MAQTDKIAADTIAPMELIDLNVDLTPNINQKFYIPEEDPAEKETDLSNKIRWTEVPNQRTTSPLMVAPSEEADERTEHLDQVKFSKVYSILYKTCNSNYTFTDRELTDNIIDCIKDNEVVGYIEIDGGYAFAYAGNNEINSKEIGFFNTVGEAQIELVDYLQLNKTSEVGLEYTTQQEIPIEELESVENMIVPESKGISWTHYYDVPQFREASVKGVIKYRARPVEIESIQFTGTVENRTTLEEWFKSSSYSDYSFSEDKNGKINKLKVKTLEGNVEASIQDFIVKGIKKEFWPVKPDIFKEKYENITDGNERNASKLNFILKKAVGFEPIEDAIARNDFSKLQNIIEQEKAEGEDINRITKAFRRTPLIESIRSHFNEAILALLEAGADVNTPDARGWSPLLWAVYSMQPDVVSLLLSEGALADYSILQMAKAIGESSSISLIEEALGLDSTTTDAIKELAYQVEDTENKGAGESKEAKITNQVVNHNTKKPVNRLNNDVTGDKAGNNVYPNEPTGQPLAPTANIKHKQAAETLTDGVIQDELPRQDVVVYDSFLNPELAEMQRREKERIKQEVKMENPIITHVPRDLKWYPIEDPNLGGKLFYQSDEATQGFMFAE